MRILQLGDLYSFHTIRWHKILKDAGYEVITAGFEPPRDEWQKNVVYVKPVIEKRPFRYLVIPKALKSLYEKFNPDIVIAHMIGSYGYVASKIHRGKIIMVGWGPDVLITPFKSPVHRGFLKTVLKKASLVVVDANNMKEILNKLGVNKDKIRIFPFGPEKKWYVYPEKAGISEPVKMASHRKLEPEYDPFTILKALKYLKDAGVEFSFTFASFGSLEEELRTKIKELGMENSVHVTGYLSQDALIQSLLQSDIYISASLYDSTSVSLLEAMALGLYPVVSDVEANREWVIHGKNGLVFKKQDAASLAEALMKVLKIKDTDYQTTINYNYEILRKTGNFEDNVLKTVESVI